MNAYAIRQGGTFWIAYERETADRWRGKPDVKVTPVRRTEGPPDAPLSKIVGRFGGFWWAESETS